MRHRPTFPTQTNTEIEELSALLNRFAAARDGHFSGTYRNANGVYMKLMNFRRFDPDDMVAGDRGLKRHRPGRLHKAVANLTGTMRGSIIKKVVPAFRRGPTLMAWVVNGGRSTVLVRRLAGFGHRRR